MWAAPSDSYMTLMYALTPNRDKVHHGRGPELLVRGTINADFV
jgi:hypothetical protein